MNIPEKLKYTETHEWLKIENNIGICGITDYAQMELSDIVYVELPKIGKEVKKGDSIASIEAVKAVVDVYSPISGKIIEVNKNLDNDPTIINKDPYGEGWLVKIEIANKNEIIDLLNADQYTKLIEKH